MTDFILIELVGRVEVWIFSK